MEKILAGKEFGERIEVSLKINARTRELQKNSNTTTKASVGISLNPKQTNCAREKCKTKKS